MSHKLRTAMASWVLGLAWVWGCAGSSNADKAADPSGDAGGTGGDAGAQDAAIDSPFVGTMSCGSVPVASPKCADCADQRCCDQGYACADHQDCLDLRECRRGCAATDDACQDACEQQHPEGAIYDAALSACRMHECADQCFGGADVGCGFSLSPALCQDCAASACCDVGYARHLEPSFWEYAACIGGCVDDGCFAACSTAHSDGDLLYATWIACVGTSCASECGIHPVYRCGAPIAGDCAACVEQSCCEASTACHEEPGCNGIARCARACGASHETCVDACEAGEPDALWEALRTCLATSCATACP